MILDSYTTLWHWWVRWIDGREGCAWLQISCQNQRSKHLNFQYIYLISYKIAKKANPRKQICPFWKTISQIF